MFIRTPVHKDKTKKLHDQKIVQKEFKKGDCVLMFQARFKFRCGNLKSNYYRPFTVTKVHSFGMVDLVEATKEEFKPNTIGNFDDTIITNKKYANKLFVRFTV